jgi:hypothetical protein
MVRAEVRWSAPRCDGPRRRATVRADVRWSAPKCDGSPPDRSGARRGPRAAPDRLGPRRGATVHCEPAPLRAEARRSAPNPPPSAPRPADPRPTRPPHAEARRSAPAPPSPPRSPPTRSRPAQPTPISADPLPTSPARAGLPRSAPDPPGSRRSPPVRSESARPRSGSPLRSRRARFTPKSAGSRPTGPVRAGVSGGCAGVSRAAPSSAAARRPLRTRSKASASRRSSPAHSRPARFVAKSPSPLPMAPRRAEVPGARRPRQVRAEVLRPAPDRAASRQPSLTRSRPARLAPTFPDPFPIALPRANLP